MYQRAVNWLNNALFPRVVAYAIHPFVILATILLLVPLLAFASVTWLALVLGNYTNVVSASVASIVLMQQLRHHAENRRMHAQHAQDIAALTAQHTALHAKVDALTLSPPPSAPANTAPDAPHAPKEPVVDTPVQVVSLVRPAAPAPARNAKGQFMRANSMPADGGDAA